NNIQSVRTINVENEKILQTLKPDIDGVLIDAPCSGLGVLKRNPDTKWNMSPERLTEILKTQEKILQTYAPLVKKGGKLVYATCSILPAENKLQVDKFLKSQLGSQFELEKEHTYFSHLTGFDGFYCARLIKKM
ncbi:MAG: RNA methyltransferase, partial [Flavobacteriaceae bacterium]